MDNKVSMITPADNLSLMIDFEDRFTFDVRETGGNSTSL